MRPLLVAVLFAFVFKTALAQDLTDPSLQSVAQSLHVQLQQTEDQLTIANARLLDDQQKIAALQAQLDVLKTAKKVSFLSGDATKYES